jgi:hypothetical protein
MCQTHARRGRVGRGHVNAHLKRIANSPVRTNIIVHANVIKVDKLVPAERLAQKVLAAGAIEELDATPGRALCVVGIVSHRRDLLVQAADTVASRARASGATVGDVWALFVLELVEVHAPR